MANKQVIRLTESDLRKIIKESVNNILTEESYRKAAKQGDNTSVANKKELKRKKRDGYKNASRDFHKFARKHNLDKMKSGASAVCNWEDGCDDNGRYVANENLSELDLHKIIKESVNKVLNEAADRFDPSDWTTNEYGEPMVWQYGDNDNEYYNWRKSEAEVKEAEELKQDILSGKYDDDILYNINRLNRCVDFSSSHLNDDIFDVIDERRTKLLKMGIKKSNKERSKFNNDEIKDLIIQLTQNPIGWSISSDGSMWSNTIITDKYNITRCPSYNAEGEESKGINGSFIRFPANTNIIYLHIGMDPNEDRNVETGCTYEIVKRDN